jgi:hypothetical protein
MLCYLETLNEQHLATVVDTDDFALLVDLRALEMLFHLPPVWLPQYLVPGSPQCEVLPTTRQGTRSESPPDKPALSTVSKRVYS